MMEYSQITTATAAVLSTLSPIEVLARQREIAGYDTLNELEELLARCSQRPSACNVVINGPDTLFISRSPAALEFLMTEVGFVRGESNASNRVDHVFLSMPNHQQATEDSADWKLFQRRLATGLRLVEWAKWANTSLIKIKISDMLWERQPAGACAIEVKVKWVDVLGRDQGELFEYDSYRFVGQQPAIVQVYESKCDSPCNIIVDVYRERMIMAKHVARATLRFPNTGVVNEIVHLYESGFDPRAEGIDDATRKANQRGCIRIDVSSIRHRFALLVDEVKRATAQADVLTKQHNHQAVPRVVTVTPPPAVASPPAAPHAAPLATSSHVVVSAPPASVSLSAAPSPDATNLPKEDSTRVQSVVEGHASTSPAPTRAKSPPAPIAADAPPFTTSVEHEHEHEQSLNLDLEPSHVQIGHGEATGDSLYSPGAALGSEKPKWMRRRGSDAEE